MSQLDDLRREYRRLYAYACQQADYGNWGPTTRLNEIADDIRRLEAEAESAPPEAVAEALLASAGMRLVEVGGDGKEALAAKEGLAAQEKEAE